MEICEHPATHPRRGFTLIEIVVAMAITAIIMTLFADLVTQYTKAAKHQEKKDRSLANVQMAIDIVSSEMEEALRIYQPDTNGATLNEVHLWRYNPENPGAKLAQRGAMTVRYYLDSNTLYREVTLLSGATPPQQASSPVADQVKSLAVQRINDKFFSLSVTLEDQQKTYTLDRKVCLKTNI